MNHILSVKAQNKAGILSKIAGLLRRKCFKVQSLNFKLTSDEKQSEFEIEIAGDKNCINKAKTQLAKIIEVIDVK